LHIPYPPARTYLLEALHGTQALYNGWLPRDAVEQVAAYLRVPLADVYGVIEFYEMFHAEPVGHQVIRVCQDASCAVAGADRLLGSLCARQGIAAGIQATARNVGMVLGVGLAGAIFTTVLSQEGGAPGISLGQTPALFDAVHVSFRVAAGVAAGGAVVSAVRGRQG